MRSCPETHPSILASKGMFQTVSSEDTGAQCNMPDCKDKFTRLYAISNYYYITGDLENSNRVIDRILEEAGPQWWMVFGYLAAMVDKKARSNA